MVSIQWAHVTLKRRRTDPFENLAKRREGLWIGVGTINYAGRQLIALYS